ncbi:rho GTPase-activating protein 29-like isoform X1 [Physella acuta]|uniref:rho GTPase-activating protein 29-like isoform X1 n=1 Tax=Physella acuta TaxID=109671 RepID=UPI0027DC6777|nr:rho GTPase-activating protein 29-like isoform X1 [Physella acuta]
MEFAGNLQATQSVLQSHKFVEPLTSRKLEHDKVYKSVKENWQRECRKMTDAVTNLRKAQALYMTRQQDHERAHDLALKADGEKLEKRRKAEEEAMHKAAEAETTYKACVAEANLRQSELIKVKSSQLGRIREQIQLCDQVIKDVTVEIFQLYHTIISPLPLQYQTLSESSKSYEPGSQYADYIRRLPGTNKAYVPDVFIFEPYVQGQRVSEETRKESYHSNGSMSDHVHSPEGSPVTSPRRDKYRIPVKAWGQQIPGVTTSDTDSASCSSKSHESSPSGSPHRTTRRLVSSQSLDELTEEEILAATHNGQDKRSQHLKRTRTVAVDDTLDLPQSLVNRVRRNTTFGVDFQEQVDTFQTKVPPIVSKCLTEIEKRGVMIKGIYRVSGVKSKVENLCQKFDMDPEAVDLDEIHPNVISNVLKLYLRQLPEPLLTFRLYSDFIHCAKENMSGQLQGETLIDHLKNVVAKLPSSNHRTCAVLIHHLLRVASHSEFNQMSASNLGIVFGPTLLRPLEGSASLASLVDTPHQTRAIELLITHAHSIFGPSEDYQVAPLQTPVENLSQSTSEAPVSVQGNTLQPPTVAIDVAKTGTADSTQLEAVSAANVQPWSCESVLPGTVSQDRNEPHSLAINEQRLDSNPYTSDPASRLKPAVTKSASSPLVTKSARSHLSSSLSVPGSGLHSDMAAALSTSAAGMASVLMMSPAHFSPAQHSEGGEVDPTNVLDGTKDQENVVDDELSEEKKGNEELAKKKLHSLQLENIKYLTKPPPSEESGSDFYKGIFIASTSPCPPLQGPKGSSEQGTVSESSVEGSVAQTAPAVGSPPCARTTPSLSKGASTRRSTLEEVPLPTWCKPSGSACGDGPLDDATVPAVTIPASPTIKRRELPSKIPTSPTIPRSADSKQNELENRAQKFRQEQRKLVKAIISDAKIGSVSTLRTSSTSSQESLDRDKNSSVFYERPGYFDDVVSGGCALSSRPSSQSEDAGVDIKENIEEKSLKATSSQVVAASQEQKTPHPTINSGSPTRSTGSNTGQNNSPKSSQSNAKKVSPAAGESSLVQTKSLPSRVRTLPSTCFVKKSASVTTPTTSKSSAGSYTAATAKSATSRSPLVKSVSGIKSTTAVTSDQSQQHCSRTTTSTSKPTDELSNKPSTSVARKSSGKGGELTGSPRSFKSPADTKPKADTNSSSPSSSQSSSPRHRHPSGESSSSRSVKPGQRKPLAAGGSLTGSPQRVHPEKSSSPSQVTGKVLATRPAQLPPVTGSAQPSQSSATTPTSSSKLSLDRTPRFV